jgi:hypothetical protein
MMDDWQAIDSVAHRRNYNETETAFITKLSQRVPNHLGSASCKGNEWPDVGYME